MKNFYWAITIFSFFSFPAWSNMQYQPALSAQAAYDVQAGAYMNGRLAADAYTYPAARRGQGGNPLGEQAAYGNCPQGRWDYSHPPGVNVPGGRPQGYGSH